MGVFGPAREPKSPPVLSRWMWVSVALSVLLVTGWFVMIAKNPNWAWFRWIMGSVVQGMMGPLLIVLGQVPWFLKVRRARAVFVASDGRMCTHCMHSLKGLSDSGRCPECGNPYEVGIDRLLWQRVGVSQG